MSNARYVSKYRSALLVVKTTPMVEYTSLIGSGELYGSPRYERDDQIVSTNRFRAQRLTLHARVRHPSRL